MHLDRLIAVLETVAIAGRAVSPADVQQATGLPRPTCYRLLQTLAEHRLLDEPEGGSRYLIGERLKRIAILGQPDVDVCQAAAPILRETAIEFGEAVFLSRFRDKTVEIIHVETPDTGVSYLHPGLGKRPLHACSCSKAVAAFSPELVTAKELEGRLKAYTEFTLTRIKDLEAEFELIRRRGYAECIEEIERGMCSVAAPLTESGSGKTMSIGATGSVRVFTLAFRAQIGKELTRLASRLSASLGWDEPRAARKSG